MPADAARSHPLLAVGLTLLMTAMFATMDTLVRGLGAWLPVSLLLGWRYATQAGVMGLWLWRRRGRAGFVSQRPGFQALRGLLLLTTSALSFLALQRMPVAEFTAVMQLGPVFVTVLAAVLLKETVSGPRWLLVFGGLAGALIVVRPGSGLFGWAALLPVAGAGCYSVFQVLTRKFALVEDPYATHFWTGAVGTAVMLPVVAAWPGRHSHALAALTAGQWVALVAVGLLGTAGHLLLVLAARLAPASTLMPFIYAQLAFATLAGWLVFARLPDAWGWLGMAVIALSGALGAWFNARRR
jgi:drug/metabolite transporter (DMT)-like permease